MNRLEIVKNWIEEDKIEDALSYLADYLKDSSNPDKDEAYYLYGNIYRKKGDWQNALNNYRQASNLNPKSPAVHAYRSILDILNFYNKDMYNQ